MNSLAASPPRMSLGLRPDAAETVESASHALLDLLIDRAIRHADRCAFQGASPALEHGQPARWRIFGGDYYEGSAGIARALAFAGRQLGRADALDTARAALRHAADTVQGWSLHSGSLGLALVQAELAPLLEDTTLQRDALALGQRSLQQALDEAERGQAGFDLMSGLAGAVFSAQELAQVEAGFADWADALSARLAEAGRAESGLHSWPMHPHEHQHLCGFGHGAAGVALALQRQPQPEAQERAAAARRFEAVHFSPAACSWADLRADGGGHPHFWCHGSVGVAIERREALASARIGEPARERAALDYTAALHGVRREAQRLLRLPQGAAAGFELNASQCHGLSGLIDLLLDTGAAEDQALAQGLGASLRRDACRPQGWRCGLPGGEPTPGLMLGWAGILWGQLRLMDAVAVPRAWAPQLGLGRAAAESARRRPQ